MSLPSLSALFATSSAARTAAPDNMPASILAVIAFGLVQAVTARGVFMLLTGICLVATGPGPLGLARNQTAT